MDEYYSNENQMVPIYFQNEINESHGFNSSEDLNNLLNSPFPTSYWEFNFQTSHYIDNGLFFQNSFYNEHLQSSISNLLNNFKWEQSSSCDESNSSLDNSYYSESSELLTSDPPELDSDQNNDFDTHIEIDPQDNTTDQSMDIETENCDPSQCTTDKEDNQSSVNNLEFLPVSFEDLDNIIKNNNNIFVNNKRIDKSELIYQYNIKKEIYNFFKNNNYNINTHEASSPTSSPTKKSWRIIEDVYILVNFNQFGTEWRLYTAVLQDRTNNEIKSRWYNMLSHVGKSFYLSSIFDENGKLCGQVDLNTVSPKLYFKRNSEAKRCKVPSTLLEIRRSADWDEIPSPSPTIDYDLHSIYYALLSYNTENIEEFYKNICKALRIEDEDDIDDEQIEYSITIELEKIYSYYRHLHFYCSLQQFNLSNLVNVPEILLMRKNYTLKDFYLNYPNKQK